MEKNLENYLIGVGWVLSLSTIIGVSIFLSYLPFEKTTEKKDNVKYENPIKLEAKINPYSYKSDYFKSVKELKEVFDENIYNLNSKQMKELEELTKWNDLEKKLKKEEKDGITLLKIELAKKTICDYVGNL